jgi:hypothetical protein
MVKNAPPEFRDRRNWDGIRAWTRKVASELSRYSGWRPA